MTSAWWQVDWVWTATGWSLVVVGAAMLAWALFWDRAKGKRRCPGCWYDLTGVPKQAGGSGEELICPECGRRIVREGQMLRTRRKWRAVAAACVLLLVGYAAINLLTYWKGGWVRLVPATALIVCAPTDGVVGPLWSGGMMPSVSRGPTLVGIPGMTTPQPPIREQIAEEVSRRLFEREMWGWQSQWFVGRVLREKRIDLGAMVRVPSRWVVGSPIPVLVDNRSEIEELGMSLQPRSEVMQTTMLGARMTTVGAADKTAARLDVPIDVVLTVPMGVVYTCTVRRSVEIVATPTEILRADNAPETTERVRIALDPRLCITPDGSVTVALDDRSAAARWKILTLGMGCEVEVRVGGEAAGTAEHRPQWSRQVFKNWDEHELRWKPGMLERARAEPDRVTIRVRGSALESWEVYREWPFYDTDPECWTGEFEVKARVVSRPETFEE